MKRFLLILAGMFLPAFTYAQSVDFKVSAGLGYKDVEVAGLDQFFGSLDLGAVKYWRLEGGSILELAYDNGGCTHCGRELRGRVWARGLATITPQFYAGVDTAVNGDKDPRAFFGLNYKKFVVEGYGQVDGDRLVGIVGRWKVK